MRVDCWDCKFFDYEEFYDGEEETRLYVCKHPKGTGHCPLSKIAPDECALLDQARKGLAEQAEVTSRVIAVITYETGTPK